MGDSSHRLESMLIFRELRLRNYASRRCPTMWKAIMRGISDGIISLSGKAPVARRAAALFLSLLILGLSSAAQEKTLKGVYEQTKKNVVLLITYDQQGEPQSLGSGVILTTSGEIVTNLHVVRSGTSILAKMWNGSFLPIDGVLGLDEASDLVILKTSGQELPPARIGPEAKPEVGNTVIAVGNPLGLEGSLSSGIVSGFRDLPGLGRVIQTTAAVSPGSSGGGLFDHEGRLVGITASTLVEGQNLNFAIPVERISQVKRFAAPLKLDELQSQLRKSLDGRAPGRVASPDSDSSLIKAKRFLGLEMFDDAEKELLGALATDKFNPEVHFYLGDLWALRKNYEKAREEFKIAANLDPQSLTPFVRLAWVDMVLLDQKHDNGLRPEALRCLRRVKQVRAETTKDRYSDRDTLSKLTADIDTLLTRLLRISGDWVNEAGGVWKFKETDDRRGMQVAKNTRIVMGSIVIVQAYGPNPPTIGFLWRNSELELQGWYGRIIPDLDCNANLALSLHESEDGMRLTGTAIVIIPEKPRRHCKYSNDSYPIDLLRN